MNFNKNKVCLKIYIRNFTIIFKKAHKNYMRDYTSLQSNINYLFFFSIYLYKLVSKPNPLFTVK